MRSVLGLIFSLLFFGLLVGAIVFLARSFGWYLGSEEFGWYYLFFFGLLIFMMGGMMRTINSVSRTGHYIFIISSTLLGFTLYLLISTLFVELLTLFTDFSPHTYGAISISIAFVISIYGIINANNTRITEFGLDIKGLSSNIRAAHLTDTHLGHIRSGKTLGRIVQKINDLNVDVVFFTGDLLDSKYQLREDSMLPLKDLNAPIFFVEGNHDKYTGVQVIKSYLQSLGVNVLTNEMTEWNGLQIIGLNHMMADAEKYSMHATGFATIKDELEKMPLQINKPSILLHHSPDGIKYANKAGVDLYLAGHTHGGQMWPATHIAKMMFDYNRGLHDFEGTKMFVSQGTGTFGPPMRVGTKSELAIINLQPA